MAQPTLIAILRGIKPDDAEQVAEILLSSGVTHFEVTLNSPSPLDSIERMVKVVGNSAMVGAGTVTDVSSVSDVNSAGAKFVVSPNCDVNVIHQTKSLGMDSYPGVFTATEAFTAINAGCDALKLFPSDVLGPSGISGLRAILPSDMPLYAVGGVKLDSLASLAKAGVRGVGIGSALYNPEKSTADLQRDASAFVASCKNIFAD